MRVPHRAGSAKVGLVKRANSEQEGTFTVSYLGAVELLVGEV